MTVASVVANNDPGMTAVLPRNSFVPRVNGTVPKKTEDTDAQKMAFKTGSNEEATIDLEKLRKAADQIQAAAAVVDVQLQFRIDAETSIVQMVITNPETDEVVLEIPPEDVLKAASSLKEIIGLLIDTTV